MARLGNANVVYDGAPYGDLVVLAEEVRLCMHSDIQTLPRVVLVDQLFECYTPLGWKQVLGCTGENEIIIVAPVAIQTEGQLWSHELTHYFGSKAEDDPCGVLALPGFSLALNDAGQAGASDAGRACAPGADQSCNDDPVISSLHGHCNDDGTCTCDPAFAKNPATGRCQ